MGELARAEGLGRHVVDPEIGVVPLEDLKQLPYDAHLGGRWLELTAEEQRLRLRDVLAELLAIARAGEEPALLRPDVGEGPAEPLDDAAVARLLAAPPERGTVVERGGRPWCEIPSAGSHGRWDWFGLWLHHDEVGALEERLSRAWWEPAQARLRADEGRPLPAPRDGGRVGRGGRGQALVAWERGGALVAPLAAIALTAALPLPWLLSAVVAIVVVIAVGWMGSGALERWYHRG